MRHFKPDKNGTSKKETTRLKRSIKLNAGYARTKFVLFDVGGYKGLNKVNDCIQISHIYLTLCQCSSYRLLYSNPIKKCVRVLDESGLRALQCCFDCTDWSVCVQSCENVGQLNDCVTDYINFRDDIQTKVKEVLCYHNNKPWITKDLKKTINEK